MSQICILIFVGGNPGGATESVLPEKAAAIVASVCLKLLFMYLSTMHDFPTLEFPMKQTLKGMGGVVS